MMSYNGWQPRCILKKIRDLLSLKYFRTTWRCTIVQKRRLLITGQQVNVSEIASIMVIVTTSYVGCSIIVANIYKNSYGGVIDFLAITRYSSIALSTLTIMILIGFFLLLLGLYVKNKELRVGIFTNKLLRIIAIIVIIAIILNLICSLIPDKVISIVFLSALFCFLFILLTIAYRHFTLLGYMASVFILSSFGGVLIISLWLINTHEVDNKYEYKIQGVEGEIENVTRLGDMMLVKVKNEKEIVLPISAFISARPVPPVDNDTKSDNASSHECLHQ